MTANLNPKLRQGEPEESPFDYRTLYAVGLEHVRRLAGEVWSDHNIHDPGITTIELLSYALTDLAYRTSWPVEDLIADAAGSADGHFFTAREILTSAPLTVTDYRKLLIDIEGVKNAWLEPVSTVCRLNRRNRQLSWTEPHDAPSDEVRVKGRWRVVIDPDDHITPLDAANEWTPEMLQVLDEARRTLNANRNLCEEFVDFTAVQSQEFRLCAKVDLEVEADPAAVQAEIEFRVGESLAPEVRRYTLADLLAKRRSDGSRYRIEEIFEGPQLAGGFIEEAELAEADLKREIYLSDIMSVLMDIPGVRAVTDIIIHPADEPAPSRRLRRKEWRIPVEPGKKAILEKASVAYRKRNMPVEPVAYEVERRLKGLRAGAEAVAERRLGEDIEPPLGRRRQTADYYSFQNHFPAIYGIGENGDVPGADDRRRIDALQLKGYLLFFDQVMANYLAQLAHVEELLSVRPGRNRTLFAGVVDSLRDYRKVYRLPEIDSLPDEDEKQRLSRETGALREELTAMAEPERLRVERRNRFLDHLLARFAERFTDYAHMMYAEFKTDPKYLIDRKKRFLAELPSLGAGRCRAFDYSRPSWNTENISGYERRIAMLLGFDPQRRALSDPPADEHCRIVESGGLFGFVIEASGGSRPLLECEPTLETKERARERMLLALRYGKFHAHYRHVDDKPGRNRFSFSVVDESGDIVASGRSYIRRDYRDDAVASLVERLRERYDDEGMYVVENLLLFPAEPGDPFLPVCPAEGNEEPEERDPYSYRLQVVLPGYTSRFSDLAFRRYAEDVIRRETPAHILPKVCWVSRDHMLLIEEAYRAWLRLKSGEEKAGRQETLARFIYVLLEGKNIYPSGRLHEGIPGDGETKFVLDRMRLGSGEE